MKKNLLIIVFVLTVALAVFSACDNGNGCKTHDFKDGACTACGEPDPNYVPPCTHTYENGECTKCGAEDPDYVPPCTHTYENGECTKCGAADPNYVPPCTHTYENGKCTKCGEADPNYVPPCTHTYENGECTKCGEADPNYVPPCAHTYENGECTKCGEADPNYVPPLNEEQIYAPVISKFQYLVLYKYMNEDLPPKGANEPSYVDHLYDVATQYSPEKSMGHAIRDINGDGIDELLFMEKAGNIHAIFTILNGELTHVHTFKLGMGYIAKGGVVFYNERIDGTLSSLRHIKRLVDGALVGFEYARIDNTDGTTAGYYKAENGVRTDITETEFRSYVDRYSYYWEYASRHVRIVGLRYNPALPESSLATSIASFATYNQIIKTFGLMYTEVAYNPVKKTSIFEKTKWTGGNYDNKMYFNTDEDFYLYNKILAACVLTQKPTAASTFGYAKKDLNGDGVEELILLEGEYHVLAIFTEVNGSAVFLDSYDDTRSAWIDASGKIHVKERPLAGLSQDAKYFVYEVEGGKLVTKLAIGVAHENVNGVQTACRWYTLDGSTETEIANSDWEVLFDEWCGDIGSSAFNTYTAEKSGLVFVKAY